MKSIATILVLGTVATLAASYFGMEGWGPYFVLCTGLAVLTAAVVAAEPVKTGRGATHRRAA